MVGDLEIKADLNSSFIKIDLCHCGQEETMEHIYDCKLLNKKEPIIAYKQTFKGNIGEQVTILQRFKYEIELNLI